MSKRLDLWSVVILSLSAIPAILPTLHSGFFSVHDEAQHIVDIYEMYRAFQVQGFPPRWAPDLNFNLGYPYFSFYYNLPFYISTLFMHLGFSITDSFKGIMFVSIISGLSGFYLFARQHFSRPSSVIAAVLYLYTPYYAVDLYVRGSVGELMVFGLLPWAAFTVSRFVQNSTLINFALSSLVIGLLTISHNVLNIFTLPLIFFYGTVVAGERYGLIKGVLKLLPVFLVGALLSCYYWLPAVGEIGFVSSYEQIKIEDQFPFIKQLIIPFWGYGVSRWGMGDELSFQIGLVNIAAVLGAVVIFVKGSWKRALPLFFLIVFLLMILLMNGRAMPFWNLNKFLRFVQFPWRMLIFTTFSSAFLVGVVSETFFKKAGEGRRAVYAAAIILVILVLNVRYFSPSEFKQVSDNNYLKLYFANRTLEGSGERAQLSRDYLGFSEDFLPPTKWQKARLTDLPKQIVVTQNPAELVYHRQGLDFSIKTQSAKDNTIYVYQTYFPGWSSTLDGKVGIVEPATDLGIVSIKLPAGSHSVDIRFEETPLRKLADILSFSAAALIIFSLVLGLKRFKYA